jgi:CheY-like chemotaxis protein
MESLGNLASGIAHDMNNVLGAILGLSSAELVNLSPGHPIYRTLSTIREAATRGGGVVRSLLTLARPSPKERRIVDFNELLLEETRLLERTTLAKVRLELDLISDLQPILGDAAGLSHVIMNLCINAVDAMGEHGTLTLSTRNVGEAHVEVTVEDTGCGMPTEVLARAMDPFFTTKEVGKGTGLGLAMVFATVKAHGGEVTLRSEVGQGTTVSLRFPALATKDLVAEPPVSDQPSAGMATLAVLLVDDDDLIQASTRMLLEVQGHQVTSTSSGEEALALLDQGLRPDAVILDMNMPGMGGKGTLPRLRDMCPTVPVFLATGRADDEAMDLVAAHPLVVLLPKPFSLGELRGHLQQISPQP